MSGLGRVICWLASLQVSFARGSVASIARARLVLPVGVSQFSSARLAAFEAWRPGGTCSFPPGCLRCSPSLHIGPGRINQVDPVAPHFCRAFPHGMTPTTRPHFGDNNNWHRVTETHPRGRWCRARWGHSHRLIIVALCPKGAVGGGSMGGFTWSTERIGGLALPSQVICEWRPLAVGCVA